MASEIDRHDYHDAPIDGITFLEPERWSISVKDGLLALCPDHSHMYADKCEEYREWLKEEVRKFRQGWR